MPSKRKPKRHMSSLAELAEQARIQAEADRLAAIEAAWSATHAEATSAVKSVLGEINLGDVAMTKRHEDRSVPLVVWSDGTVALAARRESGQWRVRVVTGSGSDWTLCSEPVKNLAELGAALAAMSGTP